MQPARVAQGIVEDNRTWPRVSKLAAAFIVYIMAHCGQCDRWFVNLHALQDHEQHSPKHARSRQQSKKTKTHTCHLCGAGLSTLNGLQQHRINKHNCCVPCNRYFASVQALRSHLQSSIHQPKSVLCPGHKCSKRCKTAAGLVNHLESGACRSGMNRARINALAVEFDKTNVITNRARLLSGSNGSCAPRPLITSIATSLSFNGRSYECFMCHRQFQTLDRLNQHLASPAHDDEIYRCPKAFQGCGKEFRVLSALCQHVESGKCGIRRFNAPMQKVIGSMSSALKGLLL